MPDWLSALLASPLVIAAIAGLITITSKAFDRRSQAWTAELLAKAALIDAEAQKTIAEAKARESLTKITASDAHVIRSTVEAQQQQIELLSLRIAYLEKLDEQKDEDLRTTRAERDEAHERIDAMIDEYARIRRAGGRLPKDTPKPFARFDSTVPFHTGKAT